MHNYPPKYKFSKCRAKNKHKTEIMVNKEICPICDGCCHNFVNIDDKSIEKIDCWACDGTGIISHDKEMHVSEKEIKIMFSALEQR